MLSTTCVCTHACMHTQTHSCFLCCSSNRCTAQCNVNTDTHLLCLVADDQIPENKQGTEQNLLLQSHADGAHGNLQSHQGGGRDRETETERQRQRQTDTHTHTQKKKKESRHEFANAQTHMDTLGHTQTRKQPTSRLWKIMHDVSLSWVRWRRSRTADVWFCFGFDQTTAGLRVTKLRWLSSCNDSTRKKEAQRKISDARCCLARLARLAYRYTYTHARTPYTHACMHA